MIVRGIIHPILCWDNSLCLLLITVNPLFEKSVHWKPCYYYIFWTLFSSHWLCYIHI